MLFISPAVRRFAFAVLMLAVLVGWTAVPEATAKYRNPLYLKLVATEPVTTVGQQPKLVATFGNTGRQTLYLFSQGCSQNVDSLQPTDSHFSPLRTLLPGQNGNFELDFKAIAPGTTEFSCSITASRTPDAQVPDVEVIKTISIVVR